MDTGEEDTAIFRHMQLDEDFVFTEILPKIPAKSLMRFKCVSKSWFDRISGDSSFIEAHLNQQPSDRRAIVLGRYQTSSRFLDDRQRMTLHSDRGLKMTEVDVSHVIAKYSAIEIVGSCNGLVCLLSVFPGVFQIPNSLLLWNPATRQLREIPNAVNNNTRSFGFGFDGASGDYKVVYLAAKYVPQLYAQVFVKSGTVWRGAKGKRRVWGRPEMLPTTGTVEANGTLHWEAYMRFHEKSIVLSFDLSDEVLQAAPGPRCDKWRLCNWRDSLAAVAPSTEGGGHDMWVATATGKNLGWSKLFKIRQTTLSFLGVMSEQILLAENTSSAFGVGMSLQLHDPKVAGEVRAIEVGAIYWRVSYSDNYFESIVSVF